MVVPLGKDGGAVGREENQTEVFHGHCSKNESTVLPLAIEPYLVEPL